MKLPALTSSCLFLAAAVALALLASGAEDGSIPQAPAVRAAVAPVFPQIARRARVVGPMVVEVSIDPSGHVAEARVVQRAMEQVNWLDEPSLAAARQWLFDPVSAPDARVARLTFDFQVVNVGSEEEVRPEELTPIFKPPFTVLVRDYLILDIRY